MPVKHCFQENYLENLDVIVCLELTKNTFCIAQIKYSL